MKKNMYICLIAVLALSFLAIWRSVIAVAAIALIVSGSACYMWDRRSRSTSIHKSAMSHNMHLIASGSILFLLALITIASGSAQASTGFTGFLFVVSYAFSMTAAPVLIWQHFAKRRYRMVKGRMRCKNQETVEYCCPAFFEPRDAGYQAKSFSYKPSRRQPNTDQKQLRIAV